MRNLDLRFFYFWRRHSFPAKMDRVLRIYTRLGDGYVWILIILAIYFFYGKETLFELVERAIFALLVSLAFYWIIKLSVRRKRPFDLLEDVKARVPPLDKYSFPSGHTMNNLAVGFIIFAETPAIGWVMIAMPITWGLLRVYYGVHWLSDVIGGACLGFLSFWLGQMIFVLFSQ